jgi:hypothetical protein
LNGEVHVANQRQFVIKKKLPLISLSDSFTTKVTKLSIDIAISFPLNKLTREYIIVWNDGLQAATS